MSKKFSIIQQINLNKIHNEINDYILQTNCFDPYIFMSDRTKDAILQEFEERYSTVRPVSEGRGAVGTYTGYKVFIDNDLEFGMVEIR